ncbi:hypothetical protein [Aliikangiella sp. IMCC44359]|uniref:hypothetical protein n=1 Tax=Aliikangiella sp. IMCC44359 TaxID=3459125 RepID=UPI00403AD0BD
MRDMCEGCSINSITQGSIFNHAVNEDYNDKDDLGLVISARCDVANKKSEKFSYLPVVNLKKFVFSVVAPKLLREQANNELNKIQSLVLNADGDPEVVELYGIETAIKTVIENEKNKNKALAALENIDKIESLLKMNWNELEQLGLDVIPNKSFEKEIKNLSQNKTEGYFLIDQVKDFNDNNKVLGPHVVFLREIHHIKASICEELKTGLLHDSFLNDSSVTKSLQLEQEQMSYVLCNIRSPYIELIMQRFSNLFCRIGVKDPDPNLANELNNVHVWGI